MALKETSTTQDVQARLGLASVRRLGVLALIVTNLLAVGLGALSILGDREAAIKSTKTDTANLAVVVEHDIGGLIARIDLALQNIRNEMDRQLVAGRVSADGINAFMGLQAARIPELSALRFADADGRIRYGSGGTASGVDSGVSIADRDHFIRARDEAGTGLVVGKPVLSRLGQKWVLPIAHRVSRKDGSFAGVVYALISLERLADNFSLLDVGKHGGIALRDAAMGLIVRVPELEGVGARVGDRSVSSTALEMASAGTAAATYMSTTPADGRVRIASVRRVGDWPLYVVASLAEDEYLSDWLRQSQRTVLLVLVLILVSLVSGGMMARSWRRGLKVVGALAESQQLFRTVTENSNDWVYWRSADRKTFYYLSPNCETITGYGVAEFEADPGLLDRIVHPDDRAAWESHLSDKREVASHADTDYRIVTRQGQVRWLRHRCREVIGADGARLGRRGTNQDVTPQKEAESALQRQLASLKALNAVASIRAASFAEMMRQALDIGARFLNLEFGIVSRVEGETYTVVSQVSPADTLHDGQTFPLGVTYCTMTVAQGSVLAIHDMAHSAHLGHPCYAAFKLETYIGAPVMVDGAVYGTVNFSSPQPYHRVFDEGDREFIVLMARWVGAAIERERSRQELADSELRLRTIVDADPECVKLLAPDGSLLQMNPAGLAMIEADSIEQVIGTRIEEKVVCAEYRAAFAALREKACGGEPGGLEFEIEGLKGGRRWLETHVVPLRNTLGAITSVLGVTRDITERRRVRLALRESERRIRALLDASSESTLLLEPDGRILAINRFGAERFGKAPESLVGVNFFDLLPPALAEARRVALQAAAQTGEHLKTSDRRSGIHFENNLYPVKNEAGVVESIAVYAKDVTEQQRTKQTEAMFHRLDLMLLKWQMNAATIAQMFCDGSLPLFDLSAAWIGRADKNGDLSLVALAESGTGAAFSEYVRAECRRWRDGDKLCVPAASVMASGLAQKFDIAEGSGAKCCEAAREAGIATSMLLPLTLRGDTWGVLALYTGHRHLFDDPSISMRLASVASRLATSLEAALQQEWLSLLETALATTGNAVFITDAAARILWVNRAFTILSGFEAEELVGATPALFKSGVQDAAFYEQLWDTVRAGNVWQGEVVNARRDGSRYTVNQSITPLRDAAGGIGHYISILEDISERKVAEARIEHMANYDMLTELPNRNLFFDRLGQALAISRRENQPGALLFLDLDRFKEVNDRFGHETGDLLLKAVAERCRECVRESDTVARLAGDEFTILLPRITAPGGAETVAAKVVEALAQPFAINDNEASIGVSIGIALFPTDGGNVESVLNAADNAMYEAKRAGRSTYRFSSGA